MISQRYNEQMGNYLAKLAKASKPQTNADRIRAMTDEELAFYIVNHPMWSDESACVAWLKSPVEVDNG